MDHKETGRLNPISADHSNTQQWGFSSVLRHPRQRFAILILTFLMISASVAAGRYMPSGVDWVKTFRPAAIALMQGHSPYTDPDLASPFAGPPWALFPILPVALLPGWLGRGFYFGVSLVGFAAAGLRMNARPVALAALLVSPPVLHCLLNANVDWMPLLGFTLPPVWGLFLVLVKPQMGFIMAFFWLAQCFKQGGLRSAIRVFAPVSAAYLLSFALYGLWPLQMTAVSGMSTGWNASLWPASIPVGVVLVTLAVYLNEARFALTASPFLSPYVLFHSWSGLVLALVRSDRAAVTACLLLWLLVAVRAGG